MKRKHIAVFTPMATGHVYPPLGLCSELVARGHRVTYPTNERFAARINEAGAEAVNFRALEISYPEKLFQSPSYDDCNYWRTFAAMYGPMLITTATAAVAELEGFYATNPPDLILYEWFSFAGRILARHLKCPAIQVHAHFAHRDWVIRVDGIRTTPEPMREFAQLLDSFMSLFGFEGKDHFWHAENVNLVLIPKEFQFDADRFDSRFKFVGVPLHRHPRAARWTSRTDQQKPLLLISEASTTADGSFLKVCIEAFSESHYHVVFSKGSNSPEIPPTLLPQNFEVNRDAFNCEILPFSHAILCQGGMGTTLESLSYGVPVVAVPSSPFNSEVAYRVAELGLGIHLPLTNLTAQILKTAVDTASFEKALRRRVRSMQEILKRTPGAALAANAIEEFLL